MIADYARQADINEPLRLVINTRSSISTNGGVPMSVAARCESTRSHRIELKTGFDYSHGRHSKCWFMQRATSYR